jgi:hypothetical protein
MQPNQGRELTFFINAFVRNIKEHSACERKKYPDHYNPPPNDEIILDERTAKRIAPTIRRVKINLHWENPRRDSEVIEDRTVKLFLTEYRHTPCYQFLYFQRQGFLNLQVVATLLLYGEMETILRGCAHPDVAIEGWLDARECQCVSYRYLHVLWAIYGVDFCCGATNLDGSSSTKRLSRRIYV